jgi:hypothetical protein
MDYKIKYFKYKIKYTKLLFMKGGMLALQNSEQRIKRMQREKIEIGIKNKKEILDYLQKYNYKIRNEEELKSIIIDKFLSKIHSRGQINNIINPLEEIKKDGINIKIISSVLSRLGDIQIKTSEKTENIDVIDIIKKYIGMLYFLSNEINPEIKVLPTPYDSFTIDSKIHYMDILLRHNLCDPETIVLYYDIENKNENIKKRSEKTKFNLKKLFDNPRLYTAIPLNQRIDELLPYIIDDIYFQKTELYVSKHIENSKKLFEEWKINYLETTSYEEIITDILKTDRSYTDIEIVFKKYKIDRAENETRKLFLKFPFSGSSKCGIKVALNRTIDINNIYNLLFNEFNKEYTSIADIDYANLDEDEITRIFPEPDIEYREKTKLYFDMLFDATNDYESKNRLYKRYINADADQRKYIIMVKDVLPTKPEMPLIYKKANKKKIIRSCLGMFYGLILQPININYNLYGEIRCLCYKGDIKVVVFSTNNSYMPFIQTIVHRSIFEKRLDSLKKEDILLKEICKKILESQGEYLYSKEANDFRLSNTNIVDSCKKTYQILKNELNIEGIHHRFDFINSRDNINHYVINEVENINFGNAVNWSIPFENKYDNKSISDNINSMSIKEQIKILDKVELFFNLILYPSIRDRQFSSLRDILLSFDY